MWYPLSPVMEWKLPPFRSCRRSGGTAMLDAAGPGLRPARTGEELSAAECLARRYARAAVGFLQRNVPGYENCYLIHHAHRPLLVDRPRALRCPALPDDGIEGCTALRRHVSGGALDVPLGMLLCPDVENLLMADDGTLRAGQIGPQRPQSQPSAGATATLEPKA